MPASRLMTSWDLVAAMAVALAGAVAAQTLAGGSIVRLVFTLAALFVAPGYLLMQASLGHLPDAGRRGRDLLLSLGLSVPTIGILALLGALWPKGFGAGGFSLGLLVGCLALACVAFLRRTIPFPRVTSPRAGSTTED